MRKFALLLGWALAGPALAQTCTVPPELWERPRSGHGIAGAEALAPCVNAHLARPSVLVVHHSRSEDGMLAAEELRTWLVALAIEAGRIELRDDLKAGAALTLEVPDDRPSK